MVTARRSFTRVRAPVVARVETRSQELLRSIAALDAEFERNASPDDGAKTLYESRRAALKSELSNALAAERRRA